MASMTDNPLPLSDTTLRERLAPHKSTKPPGQHGQCGHCMIPGWPCDQSIILNMALDSIRLRADLTAAQEERDNIYRSREVALRDQSELAERLEKAEAELRSGLCEAHKGLSAGALATRFACPDSVSSLFAGWCQMAQDGLRAVLAAPKEEQKKPR